MALHVNQEVITDTELLLNELIIDQFKSDEFLYGSDIFYERSDSKMASLHFL